MIPLAAITFAIAALPGAPAAQAPQQPPAFRTGIDLLTVEAAIFDKSGRPVPDLGPADFTVTIDGRPRKVLFARFYGGERTGIATPAGEGGGVLPPALPAHVATPGGRIVLFVVDRDTIRTGGERALIDAAGSLARSLAPGDAVGLKGLPVGGIELTREHQRLFDALPQMTGTMPPVPWRWHITWDEALGIERGDKQMLAQALNRECRPPRRPTQEEIEAEIKVEPRSPEGCDVGVRNQAMEMLLMARTQARATLANLGALAERLTPMRGPRHLVLISGGLRFDQGLLAEYNEFARRAAAAGLVLHVIHLDQPDTDIATERRNITSPFGGREMSSGLTTIAGMTGGAFFQGVGTAAGVFERIAMEMSNFYELGLETSPADADGRPRDIAIAVNRPDISVRARASVIVPARASAGAAPPDPIAAALQQPTDVAELPVAVTAYTTRGDDPDLLRVIIAADIDTPPGTTTGEWGFTVLREGNAVASGRRKMDAAPAGRWSITGSAKLAPGRYRLRFAARPGDGRTGVVDLPLAVGLRAAGDLQMSDLVVGTVDGSRLQPTGRLPAAGDLRALIEVLSGDPARLAKTRVALEIVPAGSAEPVQRVLMAARSGASDTVLMNEAHVAAGTLPPGRYTAIAIALVDNQPVGRVSRVFDVR